jgi:hypothetical protein
MVSVKWMELSFDTDIIYAELWDSEWHHLAFKRFGGQERFEVWLDGSCLPSEHLYPP